MSDYNEIKAKLSAIISQYYGTPIYIKSTLVNEEGHLIVTLSNDDVYDAGSVIGPQGIQGEQGIQGIQGKSAYQVAVDNGFEGTEQDWLKHISDGQPAFAATTADMTDQSKLYVMPDKNVYGYFAKKVLVPVNSFDPNAENVHLNARLAYGKARGTVYDEGVYNESTNPNGIQFTWTGSFITDYIPVDLANLNGNYKVKISGYAETDAVLAWGTYGGGSAMCYFDENKNHIADNLNYQNGAWGYSDTTVGEDGSVTFDLSTVKAYVYNSKNNQSALFEATKYIRFAFNPNGSRTAISQGDIDNIKVEFEAKATQQSVFNWYDTGITWTPTDYEERIISLETKTEGNEKRIANLENVVNTGVDTIPSYWDTEVSSVIETVKTKQKTIGKDGFSFIMVTDMHLDGTISINCSDNVGKISAKIMKECNIPFLAVAGDINSGSCYVSDLSDTPYYIYKDMEKANEILKYVDRDKILLMLGNHDGVWGQTTVNGVTTYYDRAIPETERFDLFMAPQGEDIRRIWGKDGTYFAIDYPQRNTRFICLNSLDMPYTVDENYKSTETPINNPMKNGGYSADELKWFSEMVKVPDGWNIVAIVHHPPFDIINKGVIANETVLKGLISAYCNHTTYSATIGTETVAADFTSEHGNFVGVFAGHLHGSYTNTDTLPCPIIVTTTAGPLPTTSRPEAQDTEPAVRPYGTAEETAFDVVTVDTKNHIIYLTRVGFGSDRQVSYTATGTMATNSTWSLYGSYENGDEVSY